MSGRGFLIVPDQSVPRPFCRVCISFLVQRLLVTSFSRKEYSLVAPSPFSLLRDRFSLSFYSVSVTNTTRIYIVLKFAPVFDSIKAVHFPSASHTRSDPNPIKTLEVSVIINLLGIVAAPSQPLVSSSSRSFLSLYFFSSHLGALSSRLATPFRLILCRSTLLPIPCVSIAVLTGV